MTGTLRAEKIERGGITQGHSGAWFAEAHGRGGRGLGLGSGGHSEEGHTGCSLEARLPLSCVGPQTKNFEGNLYI